MPPHRYTDYSRVHIASVIFPPTKKTAGGTSLRSACLNIQATKASAKT